MRQGGIHLCSDSHPPLVCMRSLSNRPPSFLRDLLALALTFCPLVSPLLLSILMSDSISDEQRCRPVLLLLVGPRAAAIEPDQR